MTSCAYCLKRKLWAPAPTYNTNTYILFSNKEPNQIYPFFFYLYANTNLCKLTFITNDMDKQFVPHLKVFIIFW